MEDSAKFLKVASELVPEHMPCVISRIYIFPNNAIELIECDGNEIISSVVSSNPMEAKC